MAACVKTGDTSILAFMATESTKDDRLPIEKFLDAAAGMRSTFDTAGRFGQLIVDMRKRQDDLLREELDRQQRHFEELRKRQHENAIEIVRDGVGQVMSTVAQRIDMTNAALQTLAVGQDKQSAFNRRTTIINIIIGLIAVGATLVAIFK